MNEECEASREEARELEERAVHFCQREDLAPLRFFSAHHRLNLHAGLAKLQIAPARA
jgi:hypothetical protein